MNYLADELKTTFNFIAKSSSRSIAATGLEQNRDLAL